MDLIKQINRRSYGDGDSRLNEEQSKNGVKFSQLKRGQTFRKSKDGSLYKKITGKKAHKVESPSNRKNRWTVDSEDTVFPVKENNNTSSDATKIMLEDGKQTQKAFEVAKAVGKRHGFEVVKESETSLCADVDSSSKQARRLKNELENTLYSLEEGEREYLDPQLNTIPRSFMFEMDDEQMDLDDDQLSRLADYMHDVLSDGEAESKYEAAAIALDDIAGFEEHSEAREQAMKQMIATYDRQYGEGSGVNESLSLPIDIKSDLMKTLAGDMTEKNASDKIRKALDKHFKYGDCDASSKKKWQTQMSGKQKEQFVRDFFHELKNEK